MKPILLRILWPISIAILLATGGCMENPAASDPTKPTPPPPVVTPATHHELVEYFASNDYGWDTIDQGVPGFILGSLPGDFDRLPEISEKKRIFFLSLLPMVLMVNDEILQQRQELLDLFDQHDGGHPLSEGQKNRLQRMVREYRLKKDPLSDLAARDRLLKRVDIVPPSLVLAQAANESGWGTSRFARLGNNLFGEWSFRPGTGMVPRRRPAGESYEVRRFPTLYDSVRSYMRNINTHGAYRALRERRAERRAEGLPLRGIDLARELGLYSIRGEEYVEEIRSIIRQNRLSHLTSATLRRS